MRPRVAALLALGAALAACGPQKSGPVGMHYFTKSYTFDIQPTQAPPHAREPITYTITILDRDTRQPIENGEGQIYANNAEGSRTWDGFANGKAVGSYVGTISYVTSGLWAVGMRFRRDSLHPLEKIEWMQDVLQERPVEERLGVDSVQPVQQTPQSQAPKSKDTSSKP